MIKNGARVLIIHKGNYKEDLVGRLGTVKRYYEGQSNIAVEVEGVHNNRSSYGYFYFQKSQLKVIKKDTEDKEETIMDGNYRIARVVYFDEPKGIEATGSVACYDFSVDVDDYVVVTTKDGYAVAKVMEVTEKTDEKLTREVVCKANFIAYFNRCDNRKRRGELMKQMEKRASELKEIALYEMLAKEDPTMAAMLDELRGIGNGN